MCKLVGSVLPFSRQRFTVYMGPGASCLLVVVPREPFLFRVSSQVGSHGLVPLLIFFASSVLYFEFPIPT